MQNCMNSSELFYPTLPRVLWLSFWGTFCTEPYNSVFQSRTLVGCEEPLICQWTLKELQDLAGVRRNRNEMEREICYIKTSAKVPLRGEVIPEVGVAYTRLSFQVRYEPYSTPPQDLSPDTHLYTQPDGLWTFLDSFLIKKKTEQCSSYSYLYLYPITTHYLFILIKVCGVGYIATVLHCTLHFS